MNIKNEIILMLTALTSEDSSLNCKIMLVTPIGLITGSYVKNFDTPNDNSTPKDVIKLAMKQAILAHDNDISFDAIMLKDVTINSNIHIASLIVFPEQVIAVSLCKE